LASAAAVSVTTVPLAKLAAQAGLGLVSPCDMSHPIPAGAEVEIVKVEVGLLTVSRKG
jgi:hypothetical protein